MIGSASSPVAFYFSSFQSTFKFNTVMCIAQMGDFFFVRKITSIRSTLTTGDQIVVVDSVITDECNSFTTFSGFSPLSEEEIRKLV